MKTYLALFLLSHLSAEVVLAATTPTFKQKESKEYFGTSKGDVKLGPNEIGVQSTDDVVITLGTELSSKVAAVLNKDCKDPGSETCQNNLKEVLGVGPGNSGLQKRMAGILVAFIGVGIAYIAETAPTVLSYIWNDGYSKHYENVIEWKIPKDQKEEIEKWTGDSGKFTYEPTEGKPIEVTLDTPPKDKPKSAPVLTKEDNGDLTITFPDRGADLEETFSQVLCSREGKRSLNKRVTVSCLLSNVRALLQQFQVGAALDGVYYIDPLKEFPKPKNELLVEAITGGEDALEKQSYWFGDVDDLKERKKKYVTLSSWMAFGYTAGHITVEGDKFTFSKDFLENQEEEEEDDKSKCTKYPTFCSNCGGNAKDNDFETLIGSCKGTSSGALKDCKCFVDQDAIDNDWDAGQFVAAYNWMASLPKEGDEDDGEDEGLSTTCKPKTLPNAFDGPNCDGCNDAQPFSEKQAYKAAAHEFCNGDWKFKAQPGYKDSQTWSATLDIFTDSVQKDPDTGFPPICAIGSNLWDSIKRPDSSKDRCLAKGSWSGNSLFRATVLPAEDQSGCKTLSDYTLPTGDACEKIFDAIVDDCITGKKDDETGGYYLEKTDNGCWEWWIYSKKDVNLKK